MNQILVSLLFLQILQITLTSSRNVTEDYGEIIQESPPIDILNPTSPQNISTLIKSIYSSSAKNNITVAPRGVGHSTYGQSFAPGGIVVNMENYKNIILVKKSYVDVSGGALWVDVLTETMKKGLSPRSWTDYLYLTVGGTLSYAGISGQAFKYGPQIVNVLELDVVTGKGDIIICSKDKNSELFHGVLGGLGQFGVITRARIVLEPAYKMAKMVIVTYDDFQKFMKAQESLITEGEVNFLEGMVNLRRTNKTVNYSLEFAIYYDDEGIAQMILDRVLTKLCVALPNATVSDMSYFDFLNRVRAEEENLRKKGLWEVPHPWLNMFVPRAQIENFKDLLINTTSDTYSGGPIIIYPFFKNKWNLNMSAMLPEEYEEDDIVYVVSFLQSAPPSCKRGTRCLDLLLNKNKIIIEKSTLNLNKGGMGAKQYLPYWKNEKQWRAHFGSKWIRFEKLKCQFDPLNILTPGQRIFKRKPLLRQDHHWKGYLDEKFTNYSLSFMSLFDK